ncbi:MAG: glycosyltransferase family 2 protein, partial [Deltaproteobacteria bacterium]
MADLERDRGAAGRPRVSVLLPAWNAEATLPAALMSVMRQTETRWECIVVDDGSRDTTLDIARRFAARDARIRVLELPHRGLVPALRAGLEACRGRTVARMDADDLMHRERLRAQLAWLRAHPDLGAVGCHVRLFPRARLREGLREYERWLNAIDSPERVRREAFVECPVAHPTLAIRRALLETFGYRDRGWPEDYDLVLRLLGAGHAIGVVPRRLVAWRDRAERLSRTSDRYAIERFTACKAEFLAAGFLAGSERYVLWGYGGTGKALRRALLAHGRRPAHIVELHPGRLGERIHGAPVIPPHELTRVTRRPVVVSVAGETARSEIRAELAAM